MNNLVHLDDLDRAYRRYVHDNNIDTNYDLSWTVIQKHARGFEFDFEEFVCITDSPPMSPSFYEEIPKDSVIKVDRFRVYRNLMCEVPEFLKEYVNV